MKAALFTAPYQIDLQEVEKPRSTSHWVSSVKGGRVVLVAIFDEEATLDPFKIGLARWR